MMRSPEIRGWGFNMTRQTDLQRSAARLAIEERRSNLRARRRAFWSESGEALAWGLGMIAVGLLAAAWCAGRVLG
jgi:hypothetical protein